MATVEYGLEVTINTGNFENVKPSIRITDEVAEGEKVSAAFNRVKGWVETLMEERIAEFKADLNG